MTSDPRLRVPLVIFTALVIHLSMLTRLRVAGVMPDLMLLLAVAGGIAGGPGWGAALGFGSGMAIDVFLQTPLGLSALVFSHVGYAVGIAQSAILRSSWWIPLVTAFAASACGEILFAVAAEVVGKTELLNTRLVVVALVVGVANALLAPLTVRLVGWSLAHDSSRGAYAA